MGFGNFLRDACLVFGGIFAGKYVAESEIFKKLALKEIDTLQAKQNENKDEAPEEKPKKTTTRKKKTEVPETTEEEP